MKIVFSCIAPVLLASLSVACGAASSTADEPAAGRRTPRPRGEVGFVVAAPDRGFLGNEELTDSFRRFAHERNAALVFVTDERTGRDLAAAVRRLAARGASRAVVLPLFLSEHESGFQVLRRAAAGRHAVPLALGQHFGASYLAVELLADRLRHIEPDVPPDQRNTVRHKAPAGRRLVVVGYGAGDAGARKPMSEELAQMAAAAARDLGFESVRAVVWRAGFTTPQRRDREAEAELADALGGPRPAVVPFQLGPRLDSMMSFPVALARHVREPARLVDAEMARDPLVALWMAREANRHLALRPDEIGVVVLAHGADHHWNQDMRAALAGLAGRYRLEFAFSMADPVVVERAVRRLEARGARAIVVVRVFALASSFLGPVERMLGLDVESGGAHAGHGQGEGHTRGHNPSQGHSHGHGHGHGASAAPSRIRSAALFATVGGLEDSPDFAGALLERAKAQSVDPARETIILTAHGDGDDETNERWKGILASLARHMARDRGARFRAIKHGTWREDWPDKREREVAAIRRMIAEATAAGGRAIVVPARTIGSGPERELLSGLDYALARGFAPHPLFEKWFEAQIRAGVAELERRRATP